MGGDAFRSHDTCWRRLDLDLALEVEQLGTLGGPSYFNPPQAREEAMRADKLSAKKPTSMATLDQRGGQVAPVVRDDHPPCPILQVVMRMIGSPHTIPARREIFRPAWKVESLQHP